MANRQFQAEFVGSFFEMSKLPRSPLPQVAVAGRSNVGKSSLLNKILEQRKLVKVSATPGKTQSLNYFLINNRFYLVDLPGYGYAKVPKAVKASWEKLIRDYLLTCRQLAGLMLLLDCRRDVTPADEKMLALLAERGLPTLAVLTKADKVNKETIRRKTADVEAQLGIAAIPFSVITGEGRKDVVASLLDLIETYRRNKKANT